MKESINIFWFRRDLRLEDNIALNESLCISNKTLLLFIFDTDITDELPENDARLNFIYDQLAKINQELTQKGKGIEIYNGNPKIIFQRLIQKFNIESVFINRDYEPYAIQRDKEISELLEENDIKLNSFQDQLIYEPGKILKKDGTPYTVFTPFKNKWLADFQNQKFPSLVYFDAGQILKSTKKLPSKKELGIETTDILVRPFNLDIVSSYGNLRDFPHEDHTSYLGPHLRFGTISIRKIMSYINIADSTFINELIWREFFKHILFFFPKVVEHSFKKKYERIKWRNDPNEFECWKKGKTGYPIVDAGMRQLNSSGYMHNRVRMIVASFLCKHLLIDWRWGEAYFAEKLLDYELSSNNGNWQWAAGTGCDAAPYFRVFNPYTQQQKFDPKFSYIRKWIQEFETSSYPLPMIDHKFARDRALTTYKRTLSLG